MPPVSGGSPATGSVASTAIVARRASVAGPVVGTPTGGSPIQWAWPSTSVSVACEATPMIDHRDHTPPCSADSSRKVPGRVPASLR